MRIEDQVMLALTMWRENRGGGAAGMQSVGNVILNRAAKHGTTVWAVCTARLQFSSLTAPGDPELGLWPADGDAQWGEALEIAAQAAHFGIQDLTGGATLYYNPRGIHTDKTFTLPDGTIVAFPKPWNPLAVKYLGEVAGHLFFAE